MAKLLKSILGNDKKLEGVKASTKEKLDLGGYTPKTSGEQHFVKKHEIEKFADRAGNGDNGHIATNKVAPYQKQNPDVYETVLHVLDTLSTHGIPMKFKDGDSQLVAPEAAIAMKSIFESLTDENKKKFVDVAFNSFEDFNDIAKLKG